jgi:hypothetical protein
VLRKRSPARADVIEQRLISALSQAKRESVVSSPTLPTPGTADNATSQRVPELAAEARAAAAVFSNVLYVQFQGQLTRELINELRTAHQQDGLATPAAERLGGQYKSAVRYFHDDDLAKANAVAARSARFFEGKKCPLRIAVEHVTSLQSQIPRGQLELWISHQCG